MQLRIVAGIFLMACGCSPDPRVELDCSAGEGAARVRSPLNGGVASAALLGLADHELDAVVQIVALDASGAELSSCTGTLVAPAWILSAAHCDDSRRATFEVRQVDAQGPSGRVAPALDVHAATDLDLALIEVDPRDFAGISPIPIAASAPSGLQGQRVQLSGTGTSEGTPGAARLFAVAEVVELTPSIIRVNASGYAGACAGDSGGALLVRGTDGVPEVAGVLSEGSVSCWAEDDYVRTDAAAAWVTEIIGATERPRWGCGQLDHVGRCFGELAVWCDGSRLVAEPCQGGASCGFEPRAPGFRCVQPARDPCAGVTDLGECREGDAVECVDGRLRRNACSQCGASCVISPRTGRAGCLEAP